MVKCYRQKEILKVYQKRGRKARREDFGSGFEVAEYGNEMSQIIGL